MGFFFMGPIDVPSYSPSRLVRIYVPKRAPASDRPLLLLFDGQNVFDDKPSFAGGWHAHTAVEKLAKNVPPPMVVGVDHGGSRRIAELSPFAFGRTEAGAPGFVDWMCRWLVPHLAHHFAGTRDPRKIVVGGSSMGGLGAFYALASRPDTFGGCIAMSPSFWVGGRAIFPWVEHAHMNVNARVYLDAGAREPAGMLRGAEAMDKLLYKKGLRNLHFFNDPRGAHAEASWRKRLLRAMRFQFGSSKGLPY